MTKPDRQLIAQVMLYSQGFRTAEVLASKIVPFFKYVFKLLPTVAIASHSLRLCDEQLSSQSHYDFGLRALKSVLVSAGNVKRDLIQLMKQRMSEEGKVVDETSISEQLHEQEVS